VIRLVSLALAAVILSGVAGLPAQAQLNPFTRSGFELSQEDIDMLKAAAAKLYVGETAAVGTVESWSNEASGNSGTVELIGLFRHQDLPCRRLQHDIRIKGVSDPYRFIFDRCKTADGSWKQL
jgi:surface antigen